LWSKSGTDLTARFPEITAAAAAAVPEGTVLDGEVVIWVGDRLDFGLLQRRFTSSRARLADEARQHPASYMVFDLLAVDGQDVRPQPLRVRRALLDELARDWTPPLQRSPVTTDEQLAQQWMRQYRPAGIEGLVVKGAGTPYEPGRRRWVKVKGRESTEVVVGAVVGPISAPTAVIAGLYQADGRLRMVGRSAVLTRGQAHTLARVLTAARADHPWPDSIAANLFGSGRDRVTLTRVEPVVVVEVAADAARQHGVWRHELRVLRLRADLTVADLPVLQRRDDTG
jgi:ATP-dependent DNA ligase